MNVNTFNISGNLTKDPQLYPAHDGKKGFCRISVAVNERRGEEETVSYFDISVPGEEGENVAASLRKGQRVNVYGKLGNYPEVITTADGKQVKRTRITLSALTVGLDLWRQRPSGIAKIGKPYPNGTEPPAGPEAQAPMANGVVSAPAAQVLAQPQPAPQPYAVAVDTYEEEPF